MSKKFFDEQTEQSQIKAKIVTEYFWTWGKIILGYQKGATGKTKIVYIDLFAGPGRYKSGAMSTPLMILEKATEDELSRKSLVTVFNDGNEDFSNSLQEEIGKLKGINKLKYKPSINCESIDEEIVKQLEEMSLAPTLMFVDPWGYKGLSLRLINSVLKDWACECIFFFNYNRINMGAGNMFVKEHIDALFGEERGDELRAQVKGMSPADRELAIIEALTAALKEMGGKYVLPFRFKNEEGARTSHHLFFVSKHPLGYKIMKSVMAKESSEKHQGVASFEYNPAADKKKFPVLFELNRPLDDLEEMLLEEFAGQTLTMEKIYDLHNVDRPYTDANYKDVLRQMELAGTIEANPPHTSRRKVKGVVTFANHVEVTFPK